MASSIKVAYEGEMRRFGASTYEELQHQVTSLFGLDTFLLKYQDEEGDLVTVSSEWELEEALRCQGPVLRLNVEAVDDKQSGDFILVEKDCVVHVDQSADDTFETFPSPLATEQPSEPTPMVLSPLPQAVQTPKSLFTELTTTTQPSATQPSATPSPSSTTLSTTPSAQPQPSTQPTQPSTQSQQCVSAAQESSVSTSNSSKRSYAEASQSKMPYSQGRTKPTYIISVSNSGANPRSSVKPHTSVTPYTQVANTQKPYAKGKDGAEFTQTPKVTAPYAQGKSSPAYARSLEDSRYVSQSHAAKPFTQVK